MFCKTKEFKDQIDELNKTVEKLQKQLDQETVQTSKALISNPDGPDSESTDAARTAHRRFIEGQLAVHGLQSLDFDLHFFEQFSKTKSENSALKKKKDLTPELTELKKRLKTSVSVLA